MRINQAYSHENQDHSMMDDGAWVARARNGDEEAAQVLFNRLYPTVMKSVRTHLPRRTSEEDLVQSVFVKIFNRLHQFSGLAPLEHWVSRIAVNTCLNQLKHEFIRPELRLADLSEEEEVFVQQTPCKDSNLPGEDGHASRELLNHVMDRLKPEERMVITLLHLEERSTEEISQIMGWSPSLVKVKAFRTRKKLRNMLKTIQE